MGQDQPKGQKMHRADPQERLDLTAYPPGRQEVLQVRERLLVAQEGAVPPAQAVQQGLQAHVVLIPLLLRRLALVPPLQNLDRGRYGVPQLVLQKQRLLVPVMGLHLLREQHVGPVLLLPVAAPAAQQLHSQELHAGLLLRQQLLRAEFQHQLHALAAK